MTKDIENIISIQKINPDYFKNNLNSQQLKEQQLQVLNIFIKKLIFNMKDLDPEFSQVVTDNFEDLI